MLRKAFNHLLRPFEYLNVLNITARDFACSSRELREIYQVEQFNKVWMDAWSHVAFYREWKKANNLPDSISSLDEVEVWPIISKKDIQKNTKLFQRVERLPDGQSMTGGSTGEPLHFGTWKEDYQHSVINTWIGRRAFGIEPGERTCLLWGHQHLYGRGFYRQVNVLKRTLKDIMLNYCRISAYDLSQSAMHLAFQRVVSFSPKFLIAYSAAMLAFCRANRGKENIGRQLHLKCVLCSAGPLTPIEQEEISSFFGAPVFMEYGSVECGVMAYTVPSGGYQVFWQTHLLQIVPDYQNAKKNIVTCLTQRYFPLIRYDIGDFLEVYPDEVRRPHRFISVLGRPSEIVKLLDGTSFWGNLIGDCVKQVPKVMANQILVSGNKITIYVLADGKVSSEEVDLIIHRCRTVVPSLMNKTILVEQMDKLKLGVSGKVSLVIYE